MLTENPFAKQMAKDLLDALGPRDIDDFMTDCMKLWAMEATALYNLPAYPKIQRKYTTLYYKREQDERVLMISLSQSLLSAIRYEITAETYSDVLGSMYEKIDLVEKGWGQYFTPEDISDFLAALCFFNGKDVKMVIEETGFASFYDGCVGSGRMFYSVIKYLNTLGVDFKDKTVMFGTDTDIRCVYMAFIQLSLYGVPAVINHGNTITEEVHSTWRTPRYVLGGWDYKMKNTAK